MNQTPYSLTIGRFAAIMLFIFGVLTFVVSPVHGTAVSQPESTSSYIVSAADMQTAVTAVQQVGGEITHELAIINAVGANLTSTQWAVLENDSAIASLQENLQLQMSTVAPQVVEVRVSSSADDAEEELDGDMSLDSSDLELIYDGEDQIVGMRFQGVHIPQGATITNAYVEFETDETDSTATSVMIQAEAIFKAAERLTSSL